MMSGVLTAALVSSLAACGGDRPQNQQEQTVVIGNGIVNQALIIVMIMTRPIEATTTMGVPTILIKII